VGIPARAVLENVPKVAFYDGTRCPEDMPFPSCMRALLEYFGEDYGCRHASSQDPTWRLGCPYSHMMGVTGNAFFLSWKPGWHGDNVAIHYMSDDPAAPYRRAFEAIGYGYEFVHREDGRDNEAFLRQRIVESIGAGRPVLAFGVIGPPEPSIIAGYDDGGEVLIGWSFFQGSPGSGDGSAFEPSGYFRKRNWFPETVGLVLVGEKRERPPLDQVYRDALAWGLQVMRTPLTYDDRRIGLAAYTAWADHLLRDEDFATDDLAVLRERHGVHDDAVGMVAEARWYGALFLAHAAQQAGAIVRSEALLSAAACFAAEHDLMWRVWDLGGGNGRTDEHVRKLAEPQARRAIAPLILGAREKDREAAAHIERALAR
jgi:hypothetical protein